MSTLVLSPPTAQPSAQDHQPASLVLATPALIAAEQPGQEEMNVVRSTHGQPTDSATTSSNSLKEPAVVAEQAGKLPAPEGLDAGAVEGPQPQLALSEPALPLQQAYQEKETGRGSREAAPPSRTGEEMLADLEESEPLLEASELLHFKSFMQQPSGASGLLGSAQEPPALTEVIELQEHQPLVLVQHLEAVSASPAPPPQVNALQPDPGQESSNLPGLSLKIAAQEERGCEVQARGAEPTAFNPGPLAPTGSLLEVGSPQSQQQWQQGDGEPQPQCQQDDQPCLTKLTPPASEAPAAASSGLGPVRPQLHGLDGQPQPPQPQEEGPVGIAEAGRAEPAPVGLSVVGSRLEPLQVQPEEQGQSAQLSLPQESSARIAQAVDAEPPSPPASEGADVARIQEDGTALPQLQQSQPPEHQQEGPADKAEAVGAEPDVPAPEGPTNGSSGLEVSTLSMPPQQQQPDDEQGQPEQLSPQQGSLKGTEQLPGAKLQPSAPAAAEGVRSLPEVQKPPSSQQQEMVEELEPVVEELEQAHQRQAQLVQQNQQQQQPPEQHQLQQQAASPGQVMHVQQAAQHQLQREGAPQLQRQVEVPWQEEVGPQQAARESKEAQLPPTGQVAVSSPQQLPQVVSPATRHEEAVGAAHRLSQVEQRDIHGVSSSTRLQSEEGEASEQRQSSPSAALPASLSYRTCKSSGVQDMDACVAATADSASVKCQGTQLQEQEMCAPPSPSKHCSSVLHTPASREGDDSSTALRSQPSSWQHSSEAPSLALQSGQNSPSTDGLAVGCSSSLSDSTERLSSRPPCSNSGELVQNITSSSSQQLAGGLPRQLTGSSKSEPPEDVPPSSMPDASALVLHSQAQQVRQQFQPLARPLTAFPVQRIQAAMGSGLTVMRDRLKTAVERETNLRLETELAAVDQLEALQARALAEANSEVERQARVLAEHEVEQLKSSMQDERRRTQQELMQLRSELKASHAAVRALEMQVASLQTELGAAVQQKTSAEQQLERVMQRQAHPLASIPAVQAELDDSSGPAKKTIPGLPYLGRLQQDSATPSKPGRTPRPFLADVRQWLSGKQQEPAPWGPPAAIASPPRPRTGRPGTSSIRSAVQQVQGPAAWAQQASPSRPQTGWQRQSVAASDTSGLTNGSLFLGQEGVRTTAQAGSQLGEPSGMGFLSGSDPDSPQQQPLARRRQQQKYTRAQSWNFKPAWTDDNGGRSEGRGTGKESASASGSRLDQVLNHLNDGLEQLRRSYSPPGSPYHTATTIPAQTPVPQPQAVQQPPLLQQQYGTGQTPVLPPPVPLTWGYQPGLQPALPIAQPYGFDARSITSLLMPAAAPVAAPALPPVQQAAPGGPPFIQYISTYHSPGSGAAADPVSRPQTAAYLGMQQSPSQLPWGQQLAYNNAFAQQPFQPPVQPTQYQLSANQPQPSYMLPQFAEQRPHTPAVGLSGGPMPGSLPMPASMPPPGGPTAVGQELPVSPTGVLAAGLPSRQPTAGYPMPGTARPKSSARNKDKPLAVPPQQMDEGSLAAARMEYLLDKHRVKAKRLRELQESPSFSLGD